MIITMNILRIIIVSCLAFILVTLHSCSDDKVDFITDLGLLKGHLIIAEELLDDGNPLMAEPHFAHSIKELYDHLKPSLKNRNVNFKSNIEKLGNNVKLTPSNPSIKEDLKEIYKIIDKLIADEKEPTAKLTAISKIIEQAKIEYKAGVKEVDDKFKVITYPEYHDARGFTVYVKELFENISEQLKQRDSNIDIAEALDKLLNALPLNPPESVDTYHSVLLHANMIINSPKTK